MTKKSFNNNDIICHSLTKVTRSAFSNINEILIDFHMALHIDSFASELTNYSWTRLKQCWSIRNISQLMQKCETMWKSSVSRSRPLAVFPFYWGLQCCGSGCRGLKCWDGCEGRKYWGARWRHRCDFIPRSNPSGVHWGWKKQKVFVCRQLLINESGLTSSMRLNTLLINLVKVLGT